MLPNPDRRLCPVFWLDHYLSRVPANPLDPAFAIRRGDSQMDALSYPQLTLWLKTWVERLGLDSGLFSSHGLRWGVFNGQPSVVYRHT